MNREIKFRAWNPKFNKMEYDVWPTSKNTVGHWIKMYGRDEWQFSDNGQTKVIIEQFTGLKDKNGEGKEVYKGDLLGSRYFSAVLIVDQMTEGSYCGQWIAKAQDGGYQDLFEAITADGYEIIGNIHQNPELLKQ